MKERKYLGDWTADLIYWIMPRVADWFHGHGCGCEGRQAKMNVWHKKLLVKFKFEENEQNQL